MKAMVLAAGFGARLRPLTDDRPKALVEVGGRPLLEIALARLRGAGVTEAIVNAHHFAGMIADYVASRDFGMRVEVSREEIVLETGGGLKQAAWFFLEDAESRDRPFLVHNVDVISTIDLGAMLRFHAANRALATLAVQRRDSSRCLLFDGEGRLAGRQAAAPAGCSSTIDGAGEPAIPSHPLRALAFCGIHVLSPRIFELIGEEGSFSIISVYLRLARMGERILAFEDDAAYWRDLGRPESVAEAEREAMRRRAI